MGVTLHDISCICADCQKMRDLLQPKSRGRVVWILIPLIIALGGISSNSLSDLSGLLPHEVETTITAEVNWFVGESKDCYSYIGSDGGAFDRIDCGKGAEHRMKITFYGRAKQPEYEVVTWNCTRTKDSFTCLELSGLKKPEGTTTGDK